MKITETMIAFVVIFCVTSSCFGKSISKVSSNDLNEKANGHSIVKRQSNADLNLQNKKTRHMNELIRQYYISSILNEIKGKRDQRQPLTADEKATACRHAVQYCRVGQVEEDNGATYLVDQKRDIENGYPDMDNTEQNNSVPNEPCLSVSAIAKLLTNSRGNSANQRTIDTSQNGHTDGETFDMYTNGQKDLASHLFQFFQDQYDLTQ
uniref:Uncharacterized LOC100178958 n=1 Tax=Ciona intestinalis TaxID=7719 RepID=F6V1E1_CIOIN|nr:uncharacterized protein LOC100178958 [Ciona intestinalis]|eukprot:XP_002119358.1 uncharacterized protein LOC100178958 [Ciona intestinalis]